MARKMITLQACDLWFNKLEEKFKSPSFLEKILTSEKGLNPYDKGQNFILFKLGFAAFLYSKGKWLDSCSMIYNCLNIHDSNIRERVKFRLKLIEDTVFKTSSNQSDTQSQKSLEQKSSPNEITIFEVKHIDLGEDDPEDEDQLYGLYPATVAYYTDSSSKNRKEETITCRVAFKQEITPGKWIRTSQHYWVKA